MNDAEKRESLNRLERLMQAGSFDTALAALNRDVPVLRELGFDPEQARAAIETPPTQLESRLGLPTSALEAIIRSTNRPPLLVRNDTVPDKASLNGPFPAGTDVKVAAVEHKLGSVGRIEFLNHDLSWGGTGWVVDEAGPDHFLIVTNRHVAELVARRTFRGDGVFMFSRANIPYAALIDFLEEVDTPSDLSREVRIEAFTYLAEDTAADVALARIRRPTADAGFGVAPLERADKDGGDQELVAVVGYPAADPFRNDPTDMQRYFKGLFDVKRFSPGYLRVQGGPTVLGHDCTTLGGNSGSPVISLYSGKVVGLHFAGQYGVGNSAVRISTINRILDAGASGDVHPVAQPAAGGGGPGGGDGGDIIGGDESRDGRNGPEHFEGRTGYDPDFLQVAPVPLPLLPPGLDIARPVDATENRPHELRYQHFSVLYSLARKSAAVVALNIDGGRARPIKRFNSRWWADLRIPEDAQLGRADYANPALDRGHLVMRAYTNWGDSDEEAMRSNLDSYHYTNASPQHMGLNRSPQQWLGLETYILENTRTHGFRACVFSGPVLGENDPPLGDSGASIPLEYFKVVTMLAEDPGSDRILRPHATAYVLSQGKMIQQILAAEGIVETAEGFVFGAYRTFQVRVRDLEAQTGYDFGPLREADPLARRLEEVADLEGLAPRPTIVLDRMESIVL